MRKAHTKKIKIKNRGMVTTSRGRFRTPLGPYDEDVKLISIMIVRENAEVVEILPDGREVPLSIQNFDKDNSNYPEKSKSVDQKNETPDTKSDQSDIKPDQKETGAANNASNSGKEMSRREKKKREREKLNQTAGASTQETATAENVSNSTEIPEEAIEQ